MTLEDDLEGGFAAAPDLFDEALVGRQRKQALGAEGAEASARGKGEGLHRERVVCFGV
jgi:hypothetical protein